MARISRIPIRLRITMVFALVLALVLAGTGSFLYLRFRSGLDASINQALRARASDVTALVQQADHGLTQSGPSPLTVKGESFAQILTPRGRIFDSTPLIRSAPILDPRQIRRALSGSITFSLAPEGRIPEGARLLATPVQAQGERLIVVVGVSLGDRTNALGQLAGLLVIGGAVALVLVSAAGYVAVAAALRPIESMRVRASGISGGAVGGRLPVPPARDEVARLGITLNDMLGRLEGALARERAFVADASHELRTPLGIVKTELELALRGTRSKPELEAAIRSAAAETDRVVQLAEDLLVLARADDGGLPVRLEPVELAALLERIRARFEDRAGALGRPLQVDCPSAVTVAADSSRLEQALGNLVDNALRHGAGAVTVQAVNLGSAVALHVTDRGDGLSAQFTAVAFDRFTRADPSRGERGSGLGLAIVAAIAEAHGGHAHAANRGSGGADFWFTVPRLTTDGGQQGR
ncbi:MAG TPA: ATP-binding protein [Solirubrobacteraceae bacterium]|nr:ATP-binding protein [Solirubrobacteraceae bacterium]